MAFGSKTKTTVLLMTSIPSLAFGTDGKTNLDTAAKFLIAAALPSPAITAAPNNVPPIPVTTLTRGINALLLAHFAYNSSKTATDLHSKFSLLVPNNPRLAAMVGDNVAGILPLAGASTVSNLAAGGTNYSGTLDTLEKLVYSLAKDNGAEITHLVVSGGSYFKIVVDQVVPIAGGGYQ
jgi:hypothetical protein